MNTTLAETVLDRWRLLRDEAFGDSDWVARNRDLDDRRRLAQKEICELARRYLEGGINTEAFRATFDRKTRHDWDVFGFKGMSGAMFLNMLVKHISDERALAEQLGLILRVPQDAEEGRDRILAFLGFLNAWITSGKVTKRQLQPARVSFFVPLWWHLQDTEQWPIFYPLSRKALESEGLYSSALDPVEDYLAFRASFLALASGLDLSSWELEHLCVWHDRKDSVSVADKAEDFPVELEEEEEPEDKQAGSPHAETQWHLAKLGQALGCRVWIPPNDRNREWNGESLRDLSLTTLPPLGIDDESRRHIEHIDVLWLKGAKVAAAFEIEHTTSVYSGLLRMSDLVALSPNLNFPLYIVTPKHRLEKVRRELRRPTFQFLELHKRCGFFSDDDLVREAENIKRYASDPLAIGKLASKVEDV